jgi:hypothetical protein
VPEIALDNEMYAFSVTDGDVVDLTVLEGSVGWSMQTGGPFQAEGTLSAGDTREFDAPAILAAAAATKIELVYPTPTMPTEPEAPAGEDDNYRPDDPDAGQNPGTP